MEIATTKKETIAIGWKYLFKPTPQMAKVVFRFALYAATILIIALKVFHGVPEEIRHELNEYALETVAFIHLVTKFFGVKNSEIEPGE